uniref:Uncharacterized protein n=1 Tax=Populus trichocarpa TaxID=3694 RepID=A9PHE1_POPTR|nr:unknown [Populus trichocarpa]
MVERKAGKFSRPQFQGSQNVAEGVKQLRLRTSCVIRWNEHLHQLGSRTRMF